MIKAAILTISDKGAAGQREDLSGQEIRRLLEAHLQAEIVDYRIVPDEKEEIVKAMRQMAQKADLLLTTGGTGIGPRDVTPEAMREVIEKELPGFGEVMRLKSFEVTPRSILSRGMAGTLGTTLIVNLPGSPKGVKECLSLLLPAIEHGLEMVKGGGHE